MEIERVGGTETIPVNVRIIAATHRDLEEMAKKGIFREDLWFRLNVFPILIPPLRERSEDIPALINYFIEKKCKEMKLHADFDLKPGTIEALQSYAWPGNVRELENLVERALIRSKPQKGKGYLHFDPMEKSITEQKTVQPEPPISPLDEMIIAHIKKALKHSKGRIEGKIGAAALLDLNPSTLRGKMRKLGLRYPGK